MLIFSASQASVCWSTFSIKWPLGTLNFPHDLKAPATCFYTWWRLGGWGEEISGDAYGQGLGHGLLFYSFYFIRLGFSSGCLEAPGNIPQKYSGRYKS